MLHQLNKSEVKVKECPLSPYIFILCAEVSATTIRKDNEVKGITVGSTECKLSQYADDTALILDGTQKSLQRSFAILEKFSEVSGLRVNCEKTEALWISSKKGSNQIICSDKNLKWADGKVKVSGVWFCIDCEESKKKDYEEKVHKIGDILIKSVSMRGPGSGDTCHLTDFNETWPD